MNKKNLVYLGIIFSFVVFPLIGSAQSSPPPMKMPSVVGQNLEEAAKFLSSKGYIVKYDLAKTDNQGLNNKIFAQNPNPGTPLPPTQTILLKAYKYESNMVVIPNVVGKSYIQAMEIFLGSGLAPKRRDKETYDPQENEKVFAQGIAAGQKVPKGTAVELIVYKLPPADITVPNVVGRSYPEAATILSRSLLTGEMVQTAEKTNDPQKNGKVFKQNPEAGKKVAKHTVVHLLLYYYESANKVKVPNVTGMLYAEACNVLSAAGVTCRFYDKKESPGDKNQTSKVIAQNPQPNQQIEKGSYVDLTLWIVELKQPKLVFGMKISEMERLAREGGFDDIQYVYHPTKKKSDDGLVMGCAYPVDTFHLKRKAQFDVLKYDGP
jgi:beta-lactam-binding protein with PASTA domain